MTATDVNNKSEVSTNGVKTSTKQQVSARNENADVAQTNDAKKKQTKANTASTGNKQATTGKSMSRYLKIGSKSILCLIR